MKYLYLMIDGLSLLGPLALSFDKRVAFYRSWKYLFLSIAIMMLLFIPWDVWFTHIGVWGFNADYLTGINIFNLPIEEVLFFVVVPYACVFIYACLNSYIQKDILRKIWRPFGVTVSIVLGIVAVCYYDQLYTAITFGLTSIFLLIHVVNNTRWFSRFLLAYLVSLIPFLLVNGILTGSGIEEQIVWYNPNHILNIRIGTIPIEDSVYNLLMLGLTIQSLEFFRKTTQK